MIVSLINPIRNHYLTYLLCFGLATTLWPGNRCMAQGERHEKVTLDLHKASMDTVLLLIEQQTGYRFFYDTADLDTTKIDIKVDQEPYTKVLSQVFTGTDLTYSLDKYGHVFVVKGEAIATD